MVHIYAPYFTSVLRVISFGTIQVCHNLYDTHAMCIINKIEGSLIATTTVVQMDSYDHVQPK